MLPRRVNGARIIPLANVGQSGREVAELKARVELDRFFLIIRTVTTHGTDAEGKKFTNKAVYDKQ
jgi:hypothetical protein